MSIVGGSRERAQSDIREKKATVVLSLKIFEMLMNKLTLSRASIANFGGGQRQRVSTIMKFRVDAREHAVSGDSGLFARQPGRIRHAESSLNTFAYHYKRNARVSPNRWRCFSHGD